MAISDNSNQGPSLNVGSYSALTGFRFAYLIDFTDPDPDDVFTYAAANVPAWLTFDQQAGFLYGRPTDHDVGSYDIEITVSDNHGGSDTQTVTVDVNAKQSTTQFVDADVFGVWDPHAVIDESRQNVLFNYADGNLSARLAAYDLDEIFSYHSHESTWDIREGLVLDGNELRLETRVVDLETGDTLGLATGSRFISFETMVERLGSIEHLNRTGMDVFFLDTDGSISLLAEAREPVELGSIVAGEFIVDGSWLPQELTDTGSWDYSYAPLLDPTDYGVTKQRFIGSAADDDFYASESPDEFVSGNTGSKHDHLTYHAIAMRGIEVDFDSGIVIEDGNGNQDIFEPHKFGMDGSQFGDEFYGIDNERIDGNGGDDFYHSLIGGAEWFNLRVGLGADLIVPT